MVHLLEVDPIDVARMTRSQREDRVRLLVAYAHEQLRDTIRRISNEGYRLVGIAVLYSGGNDSTVLAHLFRNVATHAIHANTGIGVEATRVFVRETCKAWGLPLIEHHPPVSYEELVIERGFPGPAMHWKMFQRLKERALRLARKDLVLNPRQERVIFVAGRRRTESNRRAAIPEAERQGSIEWLSPLAFWTTLDLVTYRLMQDEEGDPVPTNETSAKIHMSGECLCGAFAKEGELDEIGYWYPEVRAEIEALEAKVLAAGNAPEWACRWGWGADKTAIQAMRKAGLSDAEIAANFARSQSGRLCSSCAAAPSGGEVVVV